MAVSRLAAVRFNVFPIPIRSPRLKARGASVMRAAGQGLPTNDRAGFSLGNRRPANSHRASGTSNGRKTEPLIGKPKIRAFTTNATMSMADNVGSTWWRWRPVRARTNPTMTPVSAPSAA